MNSYFYSISKMILLLIMAALSLWLVEMSSPPIVNFERPIGHEHDLFAFNLAASIFDAQGILQRKIHTDYLEHFADDDSTELRNPDFTILQAGQPAWLIHAHHGRVSSEGETVWLEKEVVIRRPPNFPPGELTTTLLRVLPKQQYAETDQPVIINYLQNKITARGMRIYFAEKYWELLNQVRAQFYPKQKINGD